MAPVYFVVASLAMEGKTRPIGNIFTSCGGLATASAKVYIAV